VNSASALRQIRVSPTTFIFCRSVVTLGTVHVKLTRSPLRTARKSAGGFGNFSDGGFGGAMLAHAVNSSGAQKSAMVRHVGSIRLNRIEFSIVYKMSGGASGIRAFLPVRLWLRFAAQPGIVE
jgi:hypothetical protein